MMVAKMRERLPKLARAPRPRGNKDAAPPRAPIGQQADRRLWAATRLQGFGRIILAKRRVRVLRARREPVQIPDALKSKLKLRTQTGSKDLVLMSKECTGTV